MVDEIWKRKNKADEEKETWQMKHGKGRTRQTKRNKADETWKRKNMQDKQTR